MGDRGPAPKPRELKAREGNNGKENLAPEDAATPEYVDDDSAAPAFVGKYPGAEDVWNELVPKLRRLGVFAKTDLHVVGRLCVAYVMLERATVELDESGFIMEHKTGAKQVSAAFSAFTKASDMCLKLEKELGLTPSARGKVTTWGGSGQPARPSDDAEPDPGPAVDDGNEAPATFTLTGQRRA